MKVIESICDINQCTGCSACMNICPKGCIEMKKNKYGEIHPYIDKDICIQCNMCIKVCPNNNEVEFSNPSKCYAGWRNDRIKRKKSSSGGIGAVIAEKCIENNGIVIGAVYNKSNGTIHEASNNIELLDRYKGSKYVQSEIGKIFKEVERYIRENKKIVFFGTPCQVSGLLSYLKLRCLSKDIKSNLYTIDFLCHGVVPGEYLEKEINYICKKNSIDYDEISFRSNEIDKNYNLCLYKNSKLVYKEKSEKQNYFYGFLKGITIRESCVNCKYQHIGRVSDITLGDFIGIGSYEKFDIVERELVNPSMILINTIKGEEIINYCMDEISIWERTLSEAINGGPSLRGGAKISPLRIKFRKKYVKYGYSQAIRETVTLPRKVEYIYNTSKDNARRMKKKLLNGVKR